MSQQERDDYCQTTLRALRQRMWVQVTDSSSHRTQCKKTYFRPPFYDIPEILSFCSLNEKCSLDLNLSDSFQFCIWSHGLMSAN